MLFRSLDDERVAVPMAARVAVVLRDARLEMRPIIERNHARLVHHFVRDRHAVRALRDHDTVAIEHSAHAGVQAARDAPVVEREIFELVERALAERAVAGRGRGGVRPFGGSTTSDEKPKTREPYATR